jgi:hypothetical protein
MSNAVKNSRFRCSPSTGSHHRRRTARSGGSGASAAGRRPSQSRSWCRRRRLLERSEYRRRWESGREGKKQKKGDWHVCPTFQWLTRCHFEMRPFKLNSILADCIVLGFLWTFQMKCLVHLSTTWLTLDFIEFYMAVKINRQRCILKFLKKYKY